MDQHVCFYDPGLFFLWAICYLFFVCLVGLFGFCFGFFFSSLTFFVLELLYILNIKPPPNVYLAKILFHSVGSLFF